MTSEQFVKQRFPRAYAERYVSGRIRGMGVVYYLVWTCHSREEKMRLSEGKSASNAWVNAKANIIEQEKRMAADSIKL